MKPSVLMLSAERPYPLHGGGAYRTASLLHYFSTFADVDLVLLAEDAIPSPVPDGVLRSQHVIQLGKHNKSTAARYRRNAKRALLGVPPLIDRLSGLSKEISAAIGDKEYSIGIVEHFWCAPYLDTLLPHCKETVLNLHNVESVLHDSCARLENPLVALGHRRFAQASRKLEKQLLPRYSRVLVASPEDQQRVHQIAPEAITTVYPNALPWVEAPHVSKQRTVVFTANFEYHPNIDAVSQLLGKIWPTIRRRHPDFLLRLVGRGDRFVRSLADGVEGVEFTGPIPDTFSEVSRATISVAPLRAGSGTRIKILEAWAGATATVATPLAGEGLRITDGGNIFLASEPEAFADAVCQCIEDDSLQSRLAHGGRKTFEEDYNWLRAWEQLNFHNMFATARNADGYTGTF